MITLTLMDINFICIGIIVLLYFSLIRNQYILTIFIDLLSFLIIDFLIVAAITNNLNLVLVFVLLNIFSMVYFFIRIKLPGKAWQLILENKHSKRLDTLMVVLGLVFTTAFGSITSFKIEDTFFCNEFLIIAVYFIYISTNIVLLSILTMLGVYIINTMGARKPIMITLVIFIGLGLFIQETIIYNNSYKIYLEKK